MGAVKAMNDRSFIFSRMPPVDRPKQILDAAAIAFARRGFHATTVTDVASEAGVSQGLLYRYFNGKSGLVLALAERLVTEIYGAVEHADGLDGALDALFVRGPAADRAEGALIAEVLAEAIRDAQTAEVVQAGEARVVVAVSDRLRQAQRAGTVRADLDTDAAAVIVVWLSVGLALSAALTDEHSPDLSPSVTALLNRFLS